MAEGSYDCLVIGSGPGGYVAAIRAAQLGMKTAVAERDRVGGRCLNYACIPAKAVLRAADILTEVNEAGDFGVKVSGAEIDYPAVMKRRDKVVSTLTGGVSGLFKKNAIELIEGDAEIASAFARFGVEVLLFEALDRVLPTEDADISKVVERGLKKQGITVHTNTFVEGIATGESSVKFTHGEDSREVDWLVIATGRGADIEGLGLDTAGVRLADVCLIEVDGALRTSAAGVSAMGDLVR